MQIFLVSRIVGIPVERCPKPLLFLSFHPIYIGRIAREVGISAIG